MNAEYYGSISYKVIYLYFYVVSGNDIMANIVFGKYSIDLSA